MWQLLISTSLKVKILAICQLYLDTGAGLQV